MTLHGKKCVIYIVIFVSALQASAQKATSYKVGDVANLKYKEFGLGEWHDYQQDAFYVRGLDTIEGNTFLAFSGLNKCFDTFCEYKVSLQITNGQYFIDRIDTIWTSLNVPNFQKVFDLFIVAYEVENVWFDVEKSQNSYHSVEKWRGIQYVIENDKIVPLEKLSKSKLRHYRHEVLLKKGHKHHASEITEYFLHRHQRRKIDETAIHMDFSEAELYILKCMTDFIYL